MSQLRQATTHQQQITSTTPAQTMPAVEHATSGHPVDARARLLHLQRTAGNRAVGRLLARHEGQTQQPRPASPSQPGALSQPTRPIRAPPPVQRKVGFEVEMAVPTFRAGTSTFNEGPQGIPNDSISDALTGGLDYGIAFGKIVSQHNPPADIRLKPDKYTAFTNRAQAVYNALAAEPPHEGLPLVPGDGVVKTSNLEYDTDALDEMAPGSNAAFQAMATAIDNHAQQLFASTPRTTVSPISGSNPATRTGVPKWAILNNWVDIFHSDDLKTAVNDFGNSVEWKMFPQATVGILPTGLRTLFSTQNEKAQQEDKPEEGSLWAAANDVLNAVDSGVRDLYADETIRSALRAWMLNPDAVGGAAEPLDGLAFRGGLALVLSYAIGNTLIVTSLITSTNKNAVPFLTKSKSMAAFAKQAATTWLRQNPPPQALIDDIATWFHEKVPQIKTDHWTNPPYNATLVPNKERIYGGDQPALDNTKQLMNRVLRGSGTVSVVRSGHPLDPDPVPDVVKGTDQARGQKGLPLEYRWLSQQPTAAGQLWPQVFQPVLDEVRTANLQHLPAEQHDTIKQAW